MTDMTPALPTPSAKPRRPRPQVMRLTDAAAARIQELTRRADSEIVGLRVGVKNGGCAGQSYTVEYAHEVRPTTQELKIPARFIPQPVLEPGEVDFRRDRFVHAPFPPAGEGFT